MRIDELVREIERSTVRSLQNVKNIKQTMQEILVMAADFAALVKKLDDATTTIGTRIQTLVDQLQNAGLTEAQETAIHTELDAIGDRLVAMGHDPNNPVPAA